MADLTQNAVTSLLGVLSSAITDEARLLGGVPGDMQFIKDEMDSMNGFLLHLSKSSAVHNDQHRAWMKQVREIAYIAQDCIELYLRNNGPVRDADDGGGGLCATVCSPAVYLWNWPAHHRLAIRIRELKDRVRDVGERRQRYDVTVPDDKDSRYRWGKTAVQDAEDMNNMRKKFLRALPPEEKEDATKAASADSAQLAQEKDAQKKATPPTAGRFKEAIELLYHDTSYEYEDEEQDDDAKRAEGPEQDDAKKAKNQEQDDVKKTITFVVDKCKEVRTARIFLCALHANRYWTKQEINDLKGAVKEYRADVDKQVMIFCYSKLSTHYKSCLQYLTAFEKEDKISRTSLVRRWVAEGLVDMGDDKSLEEAGETCFNDLIFRGFISPVATSDAGTVRSCEMTRQVRSFIFDMAKSENFVVGLPSHLERQVKIRDIVTRQQKNDGNAMQLQPEPSPWRSSCSGAALKVPMDDLVDLLRSLPEEYRLNVMDLGGCTGVKTRHLKSICKVTSLKYLSLRKTNVTRLPRQINHLWLLETLDVRETNLRDDDMKYIRLRKLKHLLAGRVDNGGGDKGWPPRGPSISTVRMPLYVGTMTKLEILSIVSVSRGGAAILRKVHFLKNLKKLGVVVEGDDQASVESLLQAIGRLSGILSLNLWIKGNAGVNLDMNGAEADHGKLTAPLEDLSMKGNVGGDHGLTRWINDLHKLSTVTLCDTLLSGTSLRTLGALQALRSLCLRRRSFNEANLTFYRDEFVRLESLRVEDDKIDQISFQQEAAQKLEKIFWSFTITVTSKLSGIEGLPLLEKLELNAHGECKANKMQGDLKNFVAQQPKGPDFRFIMPVQVL